MISIHEALFRAFGLDKVSGFQIRVETGITAAELIALEDAGCIRFEGHCNPSNPFDGEWFRVTFP